MKRSATHRTDEYDESKSASGMEIDDVGTENSFKQSSSARGFVFIRWYSGSVEQWKDEPPMYWWYYDGGRKPTPVDATVSSNQSILAQYPWKPYEATLGMVFDFRFRCLFEKEDHYPIGMLRQMRHAIRACLAFCAKQNRLPHDARQLTFYSPTYVANQIEHLRMLTESIVLYDSDKGKVGPFGLVLVPDRDYRPRSLQLDYCPMSG
jgi:hypothetical protein